MKSTITAFLMLFCLSGFCQAKPKPTESATKTVTVTMTEQDLNVFYSLMHLGVTSEGLLNSPQVSTAQANYYRKYMDSVGASWQKVIERWHPAPPPPPKTDSTHKP